VLAELGSAQLQLVISGHGTKCQNLAFDPSVSCRGIKLASSRCFFSF